MTEQEDRRYREIGAKVYKLYLHFMTIASLFGAYWLGIVKDNNFWPIFVLCTFFWIRRLAQLSALEREAEKAEMSITEYSEFLNKKKEE